jgi:hypothetical protein
MSPGVRTGETILFEGVMVLNMVTSLNLLIVYFISNIISSFKVVVILRTHYTYWAEKYRVFNGESNV